MPRTIIDGKAYDTENAVCVANSGLDVLYVTKKGAWFLYSAFGNTFKVFDAEDAFDWLYDHAEVDAINLYFPNRIEDA
jgi:hypothetical protein